MTAGGGAPGARPSGAGRSPAQVGWTVALAVLAVAVLLAGALWWAAGVARSAVVARSLDGLSATAAVTAQQEEVAWSGALAAVEAAAGTGATTVAVAGGERAQAQVLLQMLTAGLPLRGMALYDTAGTAVAAVGATAAPSGSTPPASMVVGPPVATSAGATRVVEAPVLQGRTPVGTVVAVVDLTQLLPYGPAGRFGATGSSSLVTTGGVVVGGSEGGYGRTIRSPQNLAIAAAGRPARVILYSQFFHRLQVEAYEPLPDQGLGVLSVQAASEVLARADATTTTLRRGAGVALAAGVLGGLAAGVVAGRRRTRRHERELALAAGEARIEVAWRSSSFGSVIVALDGTWMALNPTACAMFGASEDELVGSNFAAVTHHDDRHLGPSQFARVVGGQVAAERVEVRYIRTDGTLWWGATTYAAVPGPAGGTAYVLAEIEDVTAMRATTERLAERERRFRTTLYSLEEGVVSYEFGPEGPVAVMANPAASRIVPELVVGRGPVASRTPGFAAFHPDGRPMADEELPAMVAARTRQPVPRQELEVRRADGSSQWLSAAAEVVLDDAGNAVGSTVSFADITAIRQAHADLAASQVRAAALIEHSSDLTTIADAEGTVLYASPASRPLLGLAPEELVGRRILELVHPEDRERVAAIHAELLDRPGGTSDYECRLRHRDGSWRHMEVIRTNHLADPAIGGIVASNRDVTDRVEVAARLVRQATHDELTGLPNRALLVDRLTTALARAERGGARFAVLFLDLDQFKKVNDSLGHAAGDRLLQIVAERLQGAMRPEDTVARIGGDEFVVLAEGVGSAAAAVEVAERVRQAVSRPADLAQRPVTVTCSVGIALSGRRSADALLQEADTALYRAKGRGRNRWELYDQAMRTVARRRLDVESELRAALDEDRVVVTYQPIVRLDDRHLVAVEALVRLRTAEGELLLPDSFIDVAEDSGLIIPLGARVLDKACEQAAEWVRRLGAAAPGRVAVNLSGRQLSSSRMTTTVADTLAAHSLPPERLCLELTESVLIDAGSSMRRAIEDLASMGVQLAIDDFGTGWSSLAYLQRFPIGKLKVDRSFVAGLGTSTHDTEVVKAVLGLGRALELDLVAEGIEREAQAAMLADLGCTVGQGWLYGRPGDAEAIDRLCTRPAPAPVAPAQATPVQASSGGSRAE